MPALAAVQSSYAFVSYAHLEQAVQRELAALAAIEAVPPAVCETPDCMLRGPCRG